MAIVVVNKTDSEFADRFNGQDFVFPVGKKILISEDAARHIFGLGAADKTPYFARLGWLRTQGDIPAAEARLAKFTFSAFDPYAQLKDDEPEQAPVENEQRLSPVADDKAAPTASDGTEGAAAAAGPGKKGGILDKLQGAQA